MSWSKRPETYDAGIFDILAYCSDHPEAVVPITYKTETEATTEQLRFGGFKAAWRENGRPDEYDFDLIKITRKGRVLTFQHATSLPYEGTLVEQLEAYRKEHEEG